MHTDESNRPQKPASGDDFNRILDSIHQEIHKILNSNISSSSLRKIKFLEIVHKSVLNSTLINKRALFYSSVPIFKSQSTVNSLVKNYSRSFKCREDQLNVRASLKGVFQGKVVFILKDGNRLTFQEKDLIPDMNEVQRIEHRYKKVLVVEKDTVFSNLTHEDVLTVSGKGYPCRNTVRFLELLSEQDSAERRIDFTCLTDFDPHGLHIFLVYKRSVPSMRRIGVVVEDILVHKVDRFECIKLKASDLKMLEMLRKHERFEDIRNEVEFIDGFGMKLEIEAVLSRVEFLKKI